jgi:metal-responsive CopG/Arc/MetJ family transcriptional regulator
MTDSNPPARGQGRANRISVSLHDAMFERLQELSLQEGRSLSNLCAYLLELALQHHDQPE